MTLRLRAMSSNYKGQHMIFKSGKGRKQYGEQYYAYLCKYIWMFLNSNHVFKECYIHHAQQLNIYLDE